MNAAGQQALQVLEARLKTILPEEYRECYEDMQPTPMGSAGLKYGPDGKVAWDQIWGSFCNLAMAGGPPHKGSLLRPGTAAEIEAQPDRYREVAAEICRGIHMVTGLPVELSPESGWIRVTCESRAMAGWLARAITMENVSVRVNDLTIELPVGPAYRVEKEIKNVITVIAKTCHYFCDHMWSGQQRDVAELFAKTEAESPLLQPGVGLDQDQGLREKLAAAIGEPYTLSDRTAPGWLGLECGSVGLAVWVMRLMVASNILSRREETTLFIPVNPAADPDGQLVLSALEHVTSLARERGLA